MDPQKLQCKIFVTPESARAIEPEAFIPVFHHWVRDRILPELVIDVANYGHVPAGPGVVLIGHASDYFMDMGENRLGLLCNRKRCAPNPGDRLTDLARRTFYAAELLERDAAFSGKLRFATHELLFRINDRLAAPNGRDSFDALKPELAVWTERLFEAPFDLAPVGGPKDLFAVRITTANAVPLATLLERAGGPPVTRE